jgi:hypothetical protein
MLGVPLIPERIKTAPKLSRPICIGGVDTQRENRGAYISNINREDGAARRKGRPEISGRRLSHGVGARM